MAIICPRCNHQYDVTLFEFGAVVECDCGAKIRLDPGLGVVLETENLQNRKGLTMSVCFIPGSEAIHRIKNLINEDTQVAKYNVYLTVKQIYSLGGKGGLDFSGKELSVAKREALVPKKKLPEDKYEWWRLDQGTYLMELNEQVHLNEGEIAILQPREELLHNGCFHPVQIITSGEKLSLILLNVGCKGIDIKQNARISVLRIVKR